jgi:hypothetical protein
MVETIQQCGQIFAADVGLPTRNIFKETYPSFGTDRRNGTLLQIISEERVRSNISGRAGLGTHRARGKL